MNIPSPATFKGNWYHNSSGDWCEYSVTKILNSEYYATGQYPYKPPTHDVVMIPIPAIIDLDTYKQKRSRKMVKFWGFFYHSRYCAARLFYADFL
jgi:hypothetical protein